MACCNRRGCADRFRGRVNAAELPVILRFHGSCTGCSLDVGPRRHCVLPGVP